MPGLAELVARELARRQQGDGKHPCFAFIIDDANGALTSADVVQRRYIELRAGSAAGFEA